MYQVLIMSDSHGLTKEITQIKQRHHGIEHVIHCGDSELALESPQLEGIIQVAGNCDIGEPFPDEKEITVGGLTLLVTHGHLHGVKGSLTSLSEYTAEKGVQVTFYGHDHIASAQKIADQLFINPGSMRFPRNRAEKTYAIMEWDTLSDITVNFYTVSGKRVEDLQFKGSV